MNIILIIIFLSAVAVVLGKYLARKKLFLNRECLKDEQMFNLCQLGASKENFLEVLKIVGDAYSVNYQLLRPDDCLFQRLSVIDSWNLGECSNSLEKLLEQKFGYKIRTSKETYSIEELACDVENYLSR